MKFKFLKDGREILTEKEIWCWEAYYHDGTFLKQFDNAGYFHQFKEIDQSRLLAFKMVNESMPCFTLIFNSAKMKLVHYYKRFNFDIGGPNERHFTVFCFGYEIKINGRINKVNIAITPSGEAVLTEDPNIINFA